MPHDAASQVVPPAQDRPLPPAGRVVARRLPPLHRLLAGLAPWVRARARPRIRIRLSRSVVLTAAVSAIFLFAIGGTATLGATTVTPKCDSVNLRTGPSTTYAIKGTVSAGATLTVETTVSGGSYGTTCAGAKVYGSGWHRISAVNGRSVASLFGVTYVYGASALFKTVATVSPTAAPTAAPTKAATPAPTATPTPAPTATPPPTYAALCDSVNLRTGPSTTYAIKTAVSAGTKVTAVATVSGGSWATTCQGKSVSGSGWLRISAVNGKAVSSTYGVSYLYGASGLFSLVQPPAPTAAPSASPNASAPVGPTASPTATPQPVVLPGSITFYGRGWGHGVGLSQYGAYGRAMAGQSAWTILSHYYQNTYLGSMSNSQVRVLVLQAFAATGSNPVQVYGRGGSWTIDGVAGSFPADARLRFVPTTTSGITTWRVIVNTSDGTQLYSAASSNSIRIRPGSGATLQLWSKPSAYDRYRGVLRIVGATGSSSTANVINELPIETYLRGVVPAEVSSSWPAEAVKAQAIAARSYAAYHLHPSTGTYDVYDDTRSQVYRGLLAEKSGSNSAISATAGRVLRASGNGTIANALFHSTGGGATENNENAFVSSSGQITAGVYSYLRGSMDRRPDGTAYDEASPWDTWKTKTYTLAQIQSWFAADSRTNVGSVVALDLRRRGVSGRLISVTLIGANGTTKTVSGGVFISVFNSHRPSGDPLLRSTLFDLIPVP